MLRCMHSSRCAVLAPSPTRLTHHSGLLRLRPRFTQQRRCEHKKGQQITLLAIYFVGSGDPAPLPV